MAKLSKEVIEQIAARDAAALVARAEFLKTLPKRMLDVQALANLVGVDTEVKLRENGPEIIFNNESLGVYDEIINYDSEEWQVAYVEERFAKLKAEKDERDARFELAKTIWANFSDLEKTALKENIHHLY